MYDLIIIGGGAAGLAAAVSARLTNKNISIAVFEKNDRAGKKILATGNGRCNFTNEEINADCYFGDRAFISKVLESFNSDDALDFFKRLGIMPRFEDGRVYPVTNQASAVLDALRLWLDENNVEIVTGRGVKKLTKGKAFSVGGAEARRVIIAVGGAAAPSFGTDGESYSLLTAFGHKLTKLHPALVSVKTDTSKIKGLKGVKAYAKAEILENGKVLARDTGEVLFTDYGVSGIPVMQISRFAEKGCILRLNLLPNLSYDETLTEIRQRTRMFPERQANELYSGMVNKKMIIPMLKYAGVTKTDVKARNFTDKECRKCAEFLKKLELPVLETNGMENAQVTAGGIELSGFNPLTMESKYQKGLFAAGEMLDCDGLCGGYNLHWAWATGCIAGRAAAH